MAKEPLFKTKREKTGRKFVMKEKKIDMFSTLRTRVLLTPCVCERCGFDLCEKNGLGDYDDLGAEDKARVKQALKKHKDSLVDLYLTEDTFLDRRGLTVQ